MEGVIIIKTQMETVQYNLLKIVKSNESYISEATKVCFSQFTWTSNVCISRGIENDNLQM